MNLTKPVLAALTPMAVVAITLTAAPTAPADTGGLVWPDPTEPHYWDANENPAAPDPLRCPPTICTGRPATTPGAPGRGATRCAGIHQFG